MQNDENDWTSNAAHLVGEFEPGQSPVVFNPLVTGNEVASITLNHELAHQELIRRTAFGLFYERLWLLRNTKKFGTIAKLAKDAQWWTQEGAANYTGLITAAQNTALFLSALDDLPSQRSGGPAYREAFDLFAATFPIEEGMSLVKLHGLRYLALGAARLSMGCDCLIRFLRPETITASEFEAYLEKSAPDIRLRRLLATLARAGRIEDLIKKAESGVMLGSKFAPWIAMGAILELLGNYDAVNGLELRKQHAAFNIAWHSTIRKYASEGEPARFDQFPEVPAITKDVPTTLKHEDAHNIFLDAQNSGRGLWMVLANQGKREVLVDLLLYDQDEFGNPRSDESVQKAFDTGFRSARLEKKELVQLLNEFPELPTAVTFMHGSWSSWEKFFFGSLERSNTIKVSMSRELGEVTMGMMLGMQKLFLGAEYLLTSIGLFDPDRKPIFAFFANRNLKNAYGIQYVPPAIGIELLGDLAKHFSLQPIPQNDYSNLDEIIPHFRLLEMMSTPATWDS